MLALVDDAEIEARMRSDLGPTCTVVSESMLPRGLDELRSRPIDAILIALRATDVESALAMADELREAAAGVAVLLLAAEPASDLLLEAEESGRVAQVLPLEWRPGELPVAVRRARRAVRMRTEADELRTDTEQRIEALAGLNEVATAIAGLASYADVVRVIAQRLFRVVRFDIGAAILALDDPSGPLLHIHCQNACPEALLHTFRDRTIELARSLTGAEIDERQLSVSVSGEPAAGGTESTLLGSAAHAPIAIGGNCVGLIFAAARAKDAFSPADTRLLISLADRTAQTVARIATRIHDERRRLRDMVRSMADGLILTDLGSDAVTINPSARRMLGIAPDQEVTASFLKERLGFYPFDLVVATRTTAVPEPNPLREEVKVGDRVLHSIVSPVTDSADRLVGVVVVLRDITEAKELERRQQEFVSVVSHELRTPLTSMSGAVDILLSGIGGRLTEKQRRYLEMARESCKQLNLIVDDLLDVARSETGRMPMHFTPLALDELASDAVERYLPAARAKQIALQVTSEYENVRIVGDPDRLTQVLNNLLSNAVKFTPVGGDIDVEIFGSQVAAEQVGVSVFNNGEPILEEDRERVFDKFEQLGDSTTRRVGGTGLGLAISRSIVEAHRGRIWVESQADGTKFVFTLPSAPSAAEIEEEVLAETETAAAVAVGAGATALIVFDDVHSTYILKGLLIAAGHDVLLAESADQALNLARTRHPSLAVVAARLQGGDGLALVEIFKHDPETRKTAVLVVGPASDREKALRAGADSVLEEPIQRTLFRDTCSRLIAEAGLAHSQRVLVVDDESAIRIICRDVLQAAGYKVAAVSSGAEALAEAKRFRPDLLLIDVMMPEMNGFETAERFRAETATSMAPIIFVSARGETADKVRAFRIGAEDYVVKPFDAAELVARVAKALDRHSRELSASPTTQLPGADAIEAEIERRLSDGGDHAFCYLDLDNLKAFNDYYGYAKADGVIRQTGDLIREVISREGSRSDFIGHIAGDDFVFITSAERVDRTCMKICTSFDRLVPLYYNKDDRERGYIETKDRYGVMRKFPIMGVSIATVTLRGSDIESFSDLAAAAARGKTIAKRARGSSYVRNSEVLLGGPAEEES